MTGDEVKSKKNNLTWNALRRKMFTMKTVLNQDWTDYSMFTLLTGSSKQACLICFKAVVIIKSSNVKHHYETNRSFEETNST